MLLFNGNIGTTVAPIYTTSKGKACNINNIRVNNTANTDWTLSLFQYNKATNKDILLYSFDLKAGQMINDSTVYQLVFGDSLKAISNVSTVTIAINGNEYDSNN